MEHEPTYKKIKKDVEEDNKLDMTVDELAENIAKDHLREFKNYYNDKTGLPHMEKELGENSDQSENVVKSNLNKKAQSGGTVPLYEVKCPGCNETIEITPADLVISNKVKCKKCGKVFTPTRFKPKSLKDKIAKKRL